MHDDTALLTCSPSSAPLSTRSSYLRLVRCTCTFNMTVSFRTYRDAHASLGIPGSHMVGTQGTASTGVRSLKLTCHDDSRDELLDGGARIMCDTVFMPCILVTCCACTLEGASSQALPTPLQTRCLPTRSFSAHP